MHHPPRSFGADDPCFTAPFARGKQSGSVVAVTFAISVTFAITVAAVITVPVITVAVIIITIVVMVVMVVRVIVVMPGGIVMFIVLLPDRIVIARPAAGTVLFAHILRLDRCQDKTIAWFGLNQPRTAHDLRHHKAIEVIGICGACADQDCTRGKNNPFHVVVLYLFRLGAAMCGVLPNWSDNDQQVYSALV
jgi:hypothetical protein